jgi:hypothetical protein
MGRAERAYLSLGVRPKKDCFEGLHDGKRQIQSYDNLRKSLMYSSSLDGGICSALRLSSVE